MPIGEFLRLVSGRVLRAGALSEEGDSTIQRNRDRVYAVRGRLSGYSPRASWSDFNRGQFGGKQTGN